MIGMVSFFSISICYHTGSKSTRTDQNVYNFRIGKIYAGRAGCSSLLGHFVTIGIIYLMKLDDTCANFTPESKNSSY